MTIELAFRQFITNHIKQLGLKPGSVIDPFISQPFFGSTFNLSDEVMIEITEKAALSVGLRPLLT